MDFMNSLETFALENASKVDFDEVEKKTELMNFAYTSLHEEFRTLLESKIEGFICEQGSSVDEFYSQLKEKSEANPGGGEDVFCRLLLAEADFDVSFEFRKWRPSNDYFLASQLADPNYGPNLTQNRDVNRCS